jgi:hypothetical protein
MKERGKQPDAFENVDGVGGGQAGDGRRREVCCRVDHPRPSSAGGSTLEMHAAEMKLADATQISNLAANQAHTQLVLAEVRDHRGRRRALVAAHWGPDGAG